MKRPRLPRLPRLRRKTAPQPSGTPQPPPAGTEAPTGEHTQTSALDGIRAWLGQVDRQIRIRSVIGAALAVAAMAAAGVAIYLALDVRDTAAETSDLNEIRTRITEVEQNALQAAADDVAAFGRQLSDIEEEVRSQNRSARRNQSELQVANDDIEDLREELSDLSDRIDELDAELDTKADRGGGGA